MQTSKFAGTIREQIDFHLQRRSSDWPFRPAFEDEDAARYAKHAPTFLSALDGGGDVVAAAGVDYLRLLNAKGANGQKLSADGERVMNELGEMRFLLATADKAQRRADEADAAHAANGPVCWRDPEGKLVRVYRPQDAFSAGQPRSDIDLGDIVRAMLSGKKITEINNALSGGSVGAGGALVPSEIASGVIDRMRARSVCVQAGALTIPMPTRAFAFAKIDGDPVVSWAAEGASLSETGPTFAAVTLTAKTLRGWVYVSRELVEDGVGLGDALNVSFGGAMALELDRAALVGSGTGQEPLGIGAASGAAPITSMGTNGAALTNYDNVLDLLGALETANADTSALAAVMAPRTATTIAKFKDTSNQPLQTPPALAAVRRLQTTSIPVTQTQGTANNASSIIMGDFARMLIGVRSELQIVRAEAIATNQVVLGFVLRADVAWQHAASFAQLRGIIP